jgi:NAD(P)H-nitrite reductase large subunit
MSMDERDQQLELFLHTRENIKRYSKVLNRIFSPRSGLFTIMEDDTIVCRCERITAKEVFDGMEKGFRNINEIKRTRVCMGPCQGRTCESIVTELMLQKGIPIEDIGHMTIRPPITPMPISMFEEYARSLD